jgi:c-di-GMP-related signal transduction protein
MNGKSPELIRTSLTRAYFCEDFSASAGLGEKSSTLFLMGLLSLSDALLDRPLNDVLDTLAVAPELKVALCGGNNKLSDVYQLLLSMERAEWPKLTDCAARLHCPEESIPDSYKSAIQKAATIAT